MTDRLGILVQTDRHPDYVRDLARAARRRNKTIHVHFSGRGFALADHPALKDLGQFATITRSADGRPEPDRSGVGVGPGTMDLARFLASCDRCVVF